MKRPLDVSLALEDDWVKPGDSINATLASNASVGVSWFLISRNPVEADSPIPRLTIGSVPPGGRSVDVPLEQDGRYVLGASEALGALVNVTVLARAAERVEVALVKEETGVRFAPSELVVGRGSVLVFRNDGERAWTVRQMEYLLPIGSGARLSVIAPRDQGDYELRALARDAADGWGEAGAKLIIDTRKPSVDQAFGPFNGTLGPQDLPAAGGKPREHAVASPFNFSSLNVTFRASSQLPGDASIVVRVKGPKGDVLASSQPGLEGALSLADLPNGSFAVLVELSSGVNVEYSVSVAGRVVLVTPSSFFKS